MSHLAALAEYEDYDCADWDGDGASPITAPTVAHARAIYAAIDLRFPLGAVSPAGDGTICAEWDRRLLNTTFLWLDIAENYSETLRGVGDEIREERRWSVSDDAALIAYVNDTLAKVYPVEAIWTQADLDAAAEAAKKIKTAFNWE